MGFLRSGPGNKKSNLRWVADDRKRNDSLNDVHTCNIYGVFMADYRSQELCESRGGRPGLPVPNSPYGLCGRKATLSV